MSEDPSATHRVIEPSVLYVGTPVYLVSTVNPDGTPSLASASSHFARGRTIVLGLEEGGQSLDNFRRLLEITVNFPSASQWQHVERLAGVTGHNPVPEDKAAAYRFEPRKFERAGLTPVASDLVAAPRVAEVPIQLEAKVVRVAPAANGELPQRIMTVQPSNCSDVMAVKSPKRCNFGTLVTFGGPRFSGHLVRK